MVRQRRQAMPIDAVIFDCDGTLVDSLPLVAQVLREHLVSLGLGASVDHAATLFGSGRLDDSVAALARLIGRDLPLDFVPALLRRRDDAVRRHLRAIAGALDLVSALPLPIAVASNAPLPQTRLSLEVTGLLPYFGANVFSAHDVGSWKPDPGLFLHAASALGVEPSRCVVVEDSALGVAAGLAAGMTVLAIGGEASQVKGACAVGHLRDVLRHL
jgi:HAD superfamily hydrolase (TIGR01509 family)